VVVENRPRSRRSVVAALLIATALLAAGCSSDSDSGSGESSPDSTTSSGENVPVDAPGVTATEINYSILGTETNNPLGLCVLRCYASGVQAYFDYANTELGGIYGRQLKADDLIDDEFSKNQERALDIISANDSFGVFSNTIIPAGWQAISDEGIPLYVQSSIASAMSGNDNIWGEAAVRCSNSKCPNRAIPYLMKLSGRHKLATVGIGISDASKDCANYSAGGVELYKDEIGPDAEVVYKNDDMQYGFPNGVAPEVTAMKEAGADVLAACIDNISLATIVQEAKRQGLDIVPLLPSGYDDGFLEAQGALFEGAYLRFAIRPFESNQTEAQKKYVEYMDKLGGEESELSIYGWIDAALAYEGLLRAGPDFSREKVIEATNTITDFTAGGFTAPQDWTIGHVAPTPEDASQNGQAYECYTVLQIKNSEYELVGDPDKPFHCWDGKTWDWADGEPTDMGF
jgi:hypothetical protein